MGLNEFLFLLRGLEWTLALSVVGFICGAPPVSWWRWPAPRRANCWSA